MSVVRKHPNNNNKICPLPFSSCFFDKLHLDDWFYVFKYNPDLLKHEWILLLFNFNHIRDLTNRCILFSITWIFTNEQFGQNGQKLQENYKINIFGAKQWVGERFPKSPQPCWLMLKLKNQTKWSYIELIVLLAHFVENISLNSHELVVIFHQQLQ